MVTHNIYLKSKFDTDLSPNLRPRA